MAYEIRVVFQSAEAYHSAVEGLYNAFGVTGMPGTTGAGHASNGHDPFSEPALDAPVLSLDGFLADDPVTVPADGYSFTVEDRTH